MLPITRIARAASAILIVCSIVAMCSKASADPPVHPSANLFPDLEVGLEPQFVLGDLNEDGVVDLKDRAILAAIVSGSAGGSAAAGVSCLGAGDLNFDRRVDRKDLEILDGWLTNGPKLAVPALNYAPTLPCGFKHPFVALSPMMLNGQPALIRFLEKGVTNSNARFSIESGSATVRTDGNGYAVEPAASVKPGDLIAVLITLPNQRQYVYTYQFEQAPVSPPMEGRKK